jgi:hypothetical protein
MAVVRNQYPIWKVVLMEKYGSGVGTLLEGSGVKCLRYASQWWKELVLSHECASSNWFS